MSLTILFSQTIEEGDRNWYPASSLTGSLPGSLDEIDGDILNHGDRAIVITDTNVYFYRLNSISGTSESSPDVIAPDLNAGNKRWILVPVYIPTP